MGSLNKVFLFGNLVRDPELTYAGSGSPIGKFSVACNRKFKDKSGAFQEETFFGNCVLFGKGAENLQKFFVKGDPIFVEGRLRTEKWQDKTTGADRSTIVIVVDDFQIIKNKARPGEESQESTLPPRATKAGEAKTKTHAFDWEKDVVPINENEIPF